MCKIIAGCYAVQFDLFQNVYTYDVITVTYLTFLFLFGLKFFIVKQRKKIWDILVGGNDLRITIYQLWEWL